ncbi:MAG TPA: bifunctional adenosylcobinamide kinase/adenosylcobinamide-phosphate guanylyltransferase [Bryobacteraceae bacterium]
MAVILVGGGARSGKSRWALNRARQCGGGLVYIATAEALDEEMAARIARHRADRGDAFETIEEPLELARAISVAQGDAIVVDCLTLWLSNRMGSLGRGDDTTEETLAAAKEKTGEVIFVTNEVGGGIVPDNALAREFRDRSGIMNQRFADAADEVYFMMFGQALRIK